MDAKQFENADAALAAGQHWLDVDCSPCKPTQFSPGTCEKLEVLRMRYWSGQHLWHTDDGDDLGILGTPLQTIGERRVETALASTRRRVKTHDVERR